MAFTKEELKNIIKGSGCVRNGGVSRYDIRKALTSAGLVYGQTKDFWFSEGASKVCLILKDCDFVIKFATYKSGNNDVKREHQLYLKTKKYGVQMAFPKTTRLCSVNGFVFIAQDKIDYTCLELERNYDLEHIQEEMEGFVTGISSTAYREMKNNILSTYHGEYARPLDDLWGKMIIACYGKVFANALGLFIKDNDINDLHMNNIGYKNKKPILIDFCGYYD